MPKLMHNPEEYNWDFSMRKIVHLRLYTETHAEFRKKCTELELPMTEVLHEFAQKFAEGDLRLLKIIEDYKARKFNESIDNFNVGKNFEKAKSTELLNIIQEKSPIQNGGKEE